MPGPLIIGLRCRCDDVFLEVPWAGELEVGMCLMALMGAVLSVLLKASSIQNRPLAREVHGSWLSMGVQSEGLLEGSSPFPSRGQGSPREAHSLVAQGRIPLSHPFVPEGETGTQSWVVFL